MVIYGVSLLAGCMMMGLLAGNVLGMLLGVQSNVGGVGIAMLLLIFVGGYLLDRGKMPESTESGIKFWNAMYIPIVVAMAASQNVAAAFDGGLVALLAGLLSVVAGFALVPLFGRGKPIEERAESVDEENRDGSPRPLEMSSTPARLGQ